MSTIISRNTSIPCTRKSNYTTVKDYQASVSLPVYQGERTIAKENVLLSNFVLNEIEKALANVPKIEVKKQCNI